MKHATVILCECRRRRIQLIPSGVRGVARAPTQRRTGIYRWPQSTRFVSWAFRRRQAPGVRPGIARKKGRGTETEFHRRPNDLTTWMTDLRSSQAGTARIERELRRMTRESAALLRLAGDGYAAKARCHNARRVIAQWELSEVDRSSKNPGPVLNLFDESKIQEFERRCIIRFHLGQDPDGLLQVSSASANVFAHLHGGSPADRNRLQIIKRWSVLERLRKRLRQDHENPAGRWLQFR